MAENEDLEQNQNVPENVNVPEAEKQPQNVNVAENVAETDNLAVVSYVTQNDEHIQQTENVVQIEHASENEDLDQYLFWAMEAIPSMRRKLGNRFANHGCPRFKNWEFIKRGSTMSQTWLEKEADGTLTGLAELWPTRREEKEDYWRGIDDDISKGPQFVPLKGFVGKEDRAEPSSKQLHKNKRKQYHGPDDPIKRRRNFFNASPRMRTTRHVRDRPDLSPPPLDETHSPLRHPSSGGTQNGLLSSDDNHRTSSPTRQRQAQPPPPPVDRRQQSKRSEGSTSTAIPNQLLDQMRIIVREEVQSAMRTEFETLRTELFALVGIPGRSRGENHAEHVSNPYLPSDPFEAANQGLDAAHTEGSTHTETAPTDPTHTKTPPEAPTDPKTAPADPTHTETSLVSLTHTETAPTDPTHTETPLVSLTHTKTCLGSLSQTESPPTSPAQTETPTTSPADPTHTKTPPEAPTDPKTAPADPTHTETAPTDPTHTETPLVSLTHTNTCLGSPAQTESPPTSPADPTHTKIPPEAPTDPKTAPAALTHPETAPQTAFVDPKTAPADPTDTETPIVSLTHTEIAPAIPAHTGRPPEAPADPTQNETAAASPAHTETAPTHTETDDIHTPLPPSHDVHTPPPPSKRTQHEPDVSESGLPDESTSNRGNPRAGLPPSDPTEIARERWVSKWLTSPYIDPCRPMKMMEVNRKYNAFVNDPNLLFRYIGIDVSVSQSFFRELEDPEEWLGIEHVDAYLNLLCKRKNDPMEKKQFKRKVAVVDCAFFNELTLIWSKIQPDFHLPLKKAFYPGKFDVPLDLIEYAKGNKPAWGTAWNSVDDVIVPCFVGGSHWVFSVVHLGNWDITIYDSNAHLLPNNPKHRQEQVLPLRRLFPLICKKSGYFDDSKRKKQGLTCMKAVRLAHYQFPCQADGSSCGAFMLKGIEYVMMGKELSFDFVQKDIPAFRKQAARDIFANSIESE
ncbi:hypothetical protein LWI29_000361 [Acer saccharum]|uniref:Ubiquitin-like protease family profile domain-containing protein n=1 Tax=Acer saccharum TaxID=4024 RepID=A0AA39THP5_ACESA|nr:hypothetical protein LWI29_000361 [Acer saccharum]